MSVNGHALPLAARLHRVNHALVCVARRTPCSPAHFVAPPCLSGWRSGEAAKCHARARNNKLLVRALGGEWGVWAGLAACATCGQACCDQLPACTTRLYPKGFTAAHAHVGCRRLWRSGHQQAASCPRLSSPCCSAWPQRQPACCRPAAQRMTQSLTWWCRWPALCVCSRRTCPGAPVCPCHAASFGASSPHHT